MSHSHPYDTYKVDQPTRASASSSLKETVAAMSHLCWIGAGVGVLGFLFTVLIGKTLWVLLIAGIGCVPLAVAWSAAAQALRYLERVIKMLETRAGKDEVAALAESIRALGEARPSPPNDEEQAAPEEVSQAPEMVEPWEPKELDRSVADPLVEDFASYCKQVDEQVADAQERQKLKLAAQRQLEERLGV